MNILQKNITGHRVLTSTSTGSLSRALSRRNTAHGQGGANPRLAGNVEDNVWYQEIFEQLKLNNEKNDLFTYLLDSNPPVNWDDPEDADDAAYLHERIKALQELSRTNKRKFRILLLSLALSVLAVLILLASLIALVVVLTQKDPCSETMFWILDTEDDINNFNNQHCQSVTSIRLSGLENMTATFLGLSTISGNITTFGNKNCNFTFPDLKSVTDVFSNANSKTILDLPSLTAVSQNGAVCNASYPKLETAEQVVISYNDLAGISLPLLVFAGELRIAFNVIYDLQPLEIPLLHIAGPISLYGNQHINGVSLPALVGSMELLIGSNLEMSTFSAPQLENSSIVVSNCQQLTAFELPRLKYTGNFFLFMNPTLANVSVPLLEESTPRIQSPWMRWAIAMGSNAASSTPMEENEGFTVVGVYKMDALTTFEFPNLQKADSVLFLVQQNPVLTSVSVPKISRLLAVIVAQTPLLSSANFGSLVGLLILSFECLPSLVSLDLPKLEECRISCVFSINNYDNGSSDFCYSINDSFTLEPPKSLPSDINGLILHANSTVEPGDPPYFATTVNCWIIGCNNSASCPNTCLEFWNSTGCALLDGCSCEAIAASNTSDCPALLKLPIY